MTAALDPGQPGFLLGVNLPWVSYGCDFGASAWRPQGGVARPEERRRLADSFALLAGQGLRWVRWFMLCDGRSGLRVTPDGTPAGLDDCFFEDADAGLALAAEHGLRLMLVLLDFHWFGPAEWVGGVQLRGRAGLVNDGDRRAALRENVIVPVLERYGRHPAVWAWDVINEPDWVVRRTRALGRPAASPLVVRALIEEVAGDVRRHTAHRVTVGLVGARALDLVGGAALDFYQLHWYDSVADQVPLDGPVSSLGLDRPVLLGEFPTLGSPRSPRAIVDAARRGGYAGALAWSLLATDTACDATLAGPTLASLSQPDAIGPRPV